MDFDNLHQVLRNLYQEMMPLCGDMIGVAKGIAGLGALFYVAYRVWKALASAEPIDVFPLLRPFAIGLCVMFFPTVVLGTINAVMSPVVQGTHAILEGQTLDLQAYQQQKDDLEAEARRREGKAWLVDDEVYEQRLADMGITDLGEIISMCRTFSIQTTLPIIYIPYYPINGKTVYQRQPSLYVPTPIDRCRSARRRNAENIS